MRFLVLAYSYPPMINPRAVRWSAIAEYWASQGHRVDVVSGWRPGLPRQEVRGGVHVLRAGGNVSERIRSILRPQSAGAAIKRDDKTDASRRTWRCRLQRWARAGHDATWKKLYWPDSNCLWYPPAVKAAGRLLGEHRYDAVCSVSIPFTSHLVAFRLRSRMPGAAWLVDIGDPFSFLDQCPPNNTQLYRAKNIAWEQRVFRASSAVAVTSDETAQRYRDLFPDCAAKLHVIPPLATQPRGDATRTSSPIKLVYTGTLYRNIRNPTFLFELFADLLKSMPGRRLQLHLYGMVNDCGDIVAAYRDKLGVALQTHGVVTTPEARRAVAEADVLVNLGNATSYQLPSKIVDYAATGKPLLNLVTIEGDSSAAVLKSHPSTLTVRQSAYAHRPQILLDVARFIDSPPTVDDRELEQWLSPFTVENVASRYMDLAAPAQPKRIPTAAVPKAA